MADTPADSASKPALPQWLPRWEVVGLAILDVVVVILFVVIGRNSHYLPATSRPILAVLNTAIPFAICWVLVGAFAGQYRVSALHPFWHAIVRTLITGLIASPLGVLLRAVISERPVILSFVLAATGASTAMMIVWRLLWSRVRRLWWPELP